MELPRDHSLQEPTVATTPPNPKDEAEIEKKLWPDQSEALLQDCPLCVQPASYVAQTQPFVLLFTRSLDFVVKKSAGTPFAIGQDEVP